MIRTDLYSKSYRLPRDPGTAAVLSIIPGLGQLYNGEKRKGLLFLDVAAINFVLLWLMLFTDSIVTTMVSFARTFHIKPNENLIASLKGAQMGSPLSIILLGLIMTFAAYAIRDAYDHAHVARRRSIYPECVVAMPEVTSSSYLFHLAALLSFFVMALFLFQPVTNKQVTLIEFVSDQPPVQEKVDAVRVADRNSRDSGKLNPLKRPTRPGSQAQAQARATHEPSAPLPAPLPQPKPIPSAQKPAVSEPTGPSTPAPVPRPAMVARAAVHPAPTLLPPMAPKPMLAMIAPRAIAPANPGAAPLPLAQSPRTLAAMPVPSVPFKLAPHLDHAPLPLRVNRSELTRTVVPTAQPIVVSQAGYAAAAPRPVLPRGHSPASPGAPAPKRLLDSASSGLGTGTPLAVLPRPASPAADGQPGATRENNNPRAPGSVRARAVDFGAYMSELQRRIKKAWFPPRDLETKRVVVVFKIGRDGHLMKLRLERGSGAAVADNAALKAVETAAPFAPLPDGADEDVDIQFTFDYSVFGARGSFRQF